MTDLQPVTDTEQVIELQKEILSVEVDKSLEKYILDLVQDTREDNRLKLGASPRASMALYKGAQALSAVRGRKAVAPEDIQELVSPVLWKRISVKSENLLKGLTEEAAVEDIVERVAVPPPEGFA